jgi:hypothetical protein
MRGVALFAAGLFAGLVFQVGMAQNSDTDVVMMNHVGISVPNIDEAVAYYTQKMGYTLNTAVFAPMPSAKIMITVAAVAN